MKAERKGENTILLKLEGTVALMIVELDSNKWKKYLIRENGKWDARTACNKTTNRAHGEALLSHQNLVDMFKL